MKLITTTNTNYNSKLIFKTYCFNENETGNAKKEIEICFDIPFYKDEAIDFHCLTKELNVPREMRLIFMGVNDDEMKSIKESNFIIVTCVHL